MKTYFTEQDIAIRTHRISDIEPLYNAIINSAPELSATMPWCHENYCVDDTVEWVMSREDAWQQSIDYSFVVERVSTEMIIGGTSLNQFDPDHQVANLGYWTTTSEIGNGVGSIAAYLSCLFAFEQLKLNRIEIVTAVNNVASQKVAEKIGAVKEGIMRNRLMLRGENIDAIFYSVLPSDLKKPSTSI